MLERAMVRVSDHRRAIDRVLACYGLPPESLELVPSVFDWCVANDVPENNNGRMAKCLCNWDGGICRIVMCDTFTKQAFDDANFTMRLRGFVDEVEKLTSERLCLLHLLLHEIACYVLRTTEQEPRDTWAFVEMAKHDI